MEPRTSESTEPFNCIPAEKHPFLNIYGTRLTVMGYLPCVGVTLRSLESGEEHFYPAGGFFTFELKNKLSCKGQVTSLLTY